MLTPLSNPLQHSCDKHLPGAWTKGNMVICLSDTSSLEAMESFPDKWHQQYCKILWHHYHIGWSIWIVSAKILHRNSIISKKLGRRNKQP